MRQLTQIAPWPHALESVLGAVSYKDWRLSLDQVDRSGTGPIVGHGLTLSVFAQAPDSYTGAPTGFLHYFPVPPVDYDARAWTRWVFERLLDVERHESCEAFKLGGHRPYAPSHAPGSDPYTVREEATDYDRRADYAGRIS